MLIDLIHHLIYDEEPPSLQHMRIVNDFDPYNKTIRCQRCDGEGVHYYPQDRDCYEGYKLADKKRCLSCGGCGRSPEAKLLESYEKEKLDYNKHVNRHNTVAELLTKIRRNITNEERKLLGLEKQIPKLKELK